MLGENLILINADKDLIYRNIYDKLFRLIKTEKWVINSEKTSRISFEAYEYNEESVKPSTRTISNEKSEEKIYYNQRMIIDSNVLTEPRAWHVTKVNRISPNGIARIGLAQDKFDQHRDYIEIDKDTGNVIGMWADYYEHTVDPICHEEPKNLYHSLISHSGVSPELKSGGGYKKYTVKFFCVDEPIEYHKGIWSFEIDGEDASDLVTTIADEDYIKVKFIGGDSYINSVLTIKYISDDGITSSIEVGIIGL